MDGEDIFFCLYLSFSCRTPLDSQQCALGELVVAPQSTFHTANAAKGYLVHESEMVEGEFTCCATPDPRSDTGREFLHVPVPAGSSGQMMVIRAACHIVGFRGNRKIYDRLLCMEYVSGKLEIGERGE